MNKYVTMLNKIRQCDIIDRKELQKLIENLDVYQSSVLTYMLFYKNYHVEFSDVISVLFNKYPRTKYYLNCLFQNEMRSLNSDLDKKLIDLLLDIKYNRNISISAFEHYIKKLIDGKDDKEFTGIFLIHIYVHGMNNETLYNFTISMRNSGEIYDYRKYFPDKKIVRRYPTGALSEKIALLLPSMLLAVSNSYPIASPFLVAKSLSFTGGTWDKLSIIENFTFPNPGLETIEILRKYNVSMTVAKSNLCPADTILYQIRSATGTVDSIPLAAASIASKQLSCPADLLLLDVRFGQGAFFDESESKELMRKINDILIKEGFNVINRFTHMPQPNGSSIGNYLEVCEAILIMKNQLSVFNRNAIQEQIDILADFFSEIMSYYFVDLSKEEWISMGKTMLNSGEVLKAFNRLLEAHNVDKCTIDSILADPFKHFELHETAIIRPKKSGILTFIDQKKLGNIVNFGFDGYLHRIKPNILLHKRLGEHLNSNDAICSVYNTNSCDLYEEYMYTEIKSCFGISDGLY